MIELDVKIEAKDLYDYMLRHSYNSPAGVVGSCFGALMIVFAAMTGQWLYLVFGLIILLYLPWTLLIILITVVFALILYIIPMTMIIVPAFW